MVRVFQALAEERKLKRLVGVLSVESAKDYAPHPEDADYEAQRCSLGEKVCRRGADHAEAQR